MYAAVNQDTQALEPCLAELFRTCVHPAVLRLRVERSSLEQCDDCGPLTKNGTGSDAVEIEQKPAFAQRLIVTDGHLVVQAVLAKQLAKRSGADVRRGDVLELKKFEVRKARRKNGKGLVVYLGVQDYQVVSVAHRNGDISPMDVKEDASNPDQIGLSQPDHGNGSASLADYDQMSGGFVREAVPTHSETQQPEKSTTVNASAKPKDIKKAVSLKRAREIESDGDDDGFESVSIDVSTIHKRRQVLLEMTQSTPLFASTSDIERLGQSAKTGVTSLKHIPLQNGQSRSDALVASPESSLPPYGIPYTQPPLPSKTVTNHQSANLRKFDHLTTSSSKQPQKDFVASKIQQFSPETHPHVPTTAVPEPAPPHHIPNPRKHIQSPPPPEPPPQLQPTPASSTTTTSPQPPFHTLQSLINPPNPLPKSYTCTLLATITWLSPSIIHTSKTPFPPKRHIKIHDLSISNRHSGITVSVFIDARTFTPKPGTIALFRGLTMQKWEGEVILNAYPSLKDKNEKWFVDDEQSLREMGFGVKVDNLKEWWREKIKR